MTGNNSLKGRIIREAGALLPVVVEIRRHLHMHPELSYSEYETSAYISRLLTSLGIEHYTGVAGTGIVGVIRGEQHSGGLTLGLRADMDALPVSECTDAGYKSRNEGVMHACGHDAHVAMLIGTATLLMKMRKELRGTVLLVFQPGEEKAPGGARLMIETGIFDSYKPDFFLAQHVLPEMPAGTLGFNAGPSMASCDEIYITVRGKGGHAAQPSKYTDQIYIASELVIALKDTIALLGKDHEPTILGIGNISGKGATNIIPETVEMACTFRAFDEQWRARAKETIRQVADNIASGRQVKIEVNIVEGYPVLINNPVLTERARHLCVSLAGEDKVLEVPVRMGSEDFSFFSEKYPSCLFRLGVSIAGGEAKTLHTPSFDLDENAMATGVAGMTWLAMNLTAPQEG